MPIIHRLLHRPNATFAACRWRMSANSRQRSPRRRCWFSVATAAAKSRLRPFSRTADRAIACVQREKRRQFHLIEWRARWRPAVHSSGPANLSREPTGAACFGEHVTARYIFPDPYRAGSRRTDRRSRRPRCSRNLEICSRPGRVDVIKMPRSPEQSWPIDNRREKHPCGSRRLIQMLPIPHPPVPY